MERLQKVISQAGITSRRRAEKLILDGRVMVNGKVVTELGTKIDPNIDEVKVDGKTITLNENKIVVLFNKPKRVITTMDDPEGRKKVIDFLKINERVYPVGRLDYNSEGLILLTNDGELANRLMHPRYELEKTYEVTVRGRPQEEEINQLRDGILLEEGKTSPAEITEIESIEHRGYIFTKFSMTIHEGKNRQIRRMFDYINYSVSRLKRVKYGFLTLKGLKTGEYRLLSKEEICRLKKSLSLACSK